MENREKRGRRASREGEEGRRRFCVFVLVVDHVLNKDMSLSVEATFGNFA